MTYRVFQKSVASADMANLADFTEQNLRYAFINFYESLEEENCEVVPREVDDEVAETAAVSLEVIDYHLYMGYLSMNREQCRLNGVAPLKLLGMPPNVTMLSANMDGIAASAELSVHLQLMVKVESELGINVKDSTTGELLLKPDDLPEKEVHFMVMEGVVGTADLAESIWNVKKLYKYGLPDVHHEVRDWNIVDFDNFLKGNPHAQGGS